MTDDDFLDEAIRSRFRATEPGDVDVDVESQLTALRPRARRARHVRRARLATASVGACAVLVVIGTALSARDGGNDVVLSPSDSTASTPDSTAATTTSTVPATETTTPSVTADTTPATGSTPTSTPPTSPGPSGRTTYDGTGGSLVVLRSGEQLTLQSFAPAAGFTARVEHQEEDRIEVRFDGPNHETRIEVRMQDGRVESNVEERSGSSRSDVGESGNSGSEDSDNSGPGSGGD
jgi:hypothetical protein